MSSARKVAPGTVQRLAEERARMRLRGAPREPQSADFSALVAALGREPGKVERERFRQDYAAACRGGAS